jgi:hypothetical protein
MRKRPPASYGFQEQIDFSNGHSPDADSVFPFLRDRIPNFRGVRRALKVNDHTGCDYYVERFGLYSLGIDLKLRDEDYSVKPPHFADDLALETFSVNEQKVGWTRDATKATDYVLWYWQDTGRFFIVPFPALCAVFTQHWEEWRKQFPVSRQTTREGRRCWKSECVFVPRRLVMNCINGWMNGNASSCRVRGAA